MAALGTMAGMLAHDFRTPMTVIRGYAELLRDEAATDAGRERAQTIVQHGGPPRPHDPRDPGLRPRRGPARAAAGGRRRAASSEILGSLERELPGLTVLRRGRPCPRRSTAALDTDKLRRAVFNIAANARDAMKGAGRLHAERRTCARSAGGGGRAAWLVLTLADEGPGVPPAIRDTVFEPFVTEGKKGGTGLGLAVTRRFVEDQGGTVELLPRAPTDTLARPFASAFPSPRLKMEGMGQRGTGVRRPMACGRVRCSLCPRRVPRARSRAGS